jgi:hypothetical protein
MSTVQSSFLIKWQLQPSEQRFAFPVSSSCMRPCVSGCVSAYFPRKEQVYFV